MRIGFRFRAIPFVATVLLVALGLSLGQWQQRRAAEKIALQASLTARAAQAPLVLEGAPANPAGIEYRTVTVRGQFLAGWPLFLDNRPLHSRQGLYLLMPFKIAASGATVLVARGWLPRQAEHGRLPEYATPAGTVTIEGVVKLGMGHIMQLGSPAPAQPNAMLQNVDVGQVAAASGLSLLPLFIEQTGPAQAGDALLRDWPAPALGVEKHQGYAFQWYALALMALLFFVMTGFRRASK
ncbi:MAG: SURF1 family protein [Pseudomonadota bacterium]